MYGRNYAPGRVNDQRELNTKFKVRAFFHSCIEACLLHWNATHDFEMRMTGKELHRACVLVQSFVYSSAARANALRSSYTAVQHP